jgi:hypothetical protein
MMKNMGVTMLRKLIKKPVFCVLAMTFLLIGCSRSEVTPFPTQTEAEQAIMPTAASDATVLATPIPSTQAVAAGESETASPLAETPTPANTLPPATPTLPDISPAPAGTAIPVAGIEVYDLTGAGQAADAGAYWIRRNALPWSAIEPAEGERNWGSVAGLEAEMQAISPRGMQTILIVQYTPAWAQAAQGYACGPILPEKLNAFAAFMHDVVARYSVPPYNVKYFELGNEPDVPLGLVAGDSQFGCWYDPADLAHNADDYANMLKAVYPQVKAANPEAQVLIGGLLMDCDPLNPPQLSDGTLIDCTVSRFMEFILQNGGTNSFDGVSFHAYDYYYGALGQYGNPNWHSSWDTTGPITSAKARYLRTLLDFYNRPDAYLLNTETALLCGKTGEEESCLADDFVQTKASYIVQSYTVARAEYLLGNIWYSISGWRASGLVDGAGQPLPAYQAFRFNAQMLNGTAYVGKIADLEGVAAYEFQQAGRRVWVIWSADGNEHTVELSATPSAAYDMTGNSLTPAQTWTVNLLPVYLEWQE